ERSRKNSGALNTAVPYLSRGLFLALFGDFLFLLAANPNAISLFCRIPLCCAKVSQNRKGGPEAA
ncbi:MAG: hypothetical protein ACLP7A_12225, partial [Desulfobaccales bacterium]